jgi:hypothetical protein
LKLLVYTPKITKRVRYIFNLIFTDLLNTECNITSSLDEFHNFEGVKINYSQQPVSDEIYFSASSLLFENGIRDQALTFIDVENYGIINSTNYQFTKSPNSRIKVCFPHYDKRSVLPFDPFAASFYFVSRYEEYLPYLKDKYDRFDAKESIAYKYHFLQKPLVNIWALAIADIIKQRYTDFHFRKHQFKYTPTIDIDLFYAYKLKGFLRTAGGYFKSLSERDYKGIIERTKVLSGMIKDPFDTYSFQNELHKKHNLSPIYFILVGDYAHYDKNIPYQNKHFHSLIKSLGDDAEIGIHPSYESNNDSNKLTTEIQRLSKILNKEITKSRQHFLKLNLPYTYRNLINNDITDDYTMGYASEIGFRAAICSPFNFYDLDMDAETNLRIHPFAIMEGTLKDYRNISNPDVLDYIKPVINNVKQVNGNLLTLWHNESLSNQKRWVGWNKIYEEIVKLATE